MYDNLVGGAERFRGRALRRAIWPGPAGCASLPAMNVHPAPTARAPKARWSSSTWTSRRSTTPTTRRSMRRTARWSSSAARPRASGRGRSSARRSASPTGRASIEGLDIFDCGIKGAPVNVFVHGGAWRRNMAADYALQAEPLVRAGAHCVIIDFINVDQAERRSVPDVRAGAARARLGLAQRRELRRRPRPDLHLGAFVGLASRRRRADARLARGGPAAGRLQGRGAAERHVRSRAGAAVEALVLCEVHRRMVRASSARSAISTGCTRRSFSPSAPARRRSSSASRAISPPR